MATEYRNYIDGEWVETVRGETFQTYNPAAPMEPVGVYQDSGEEDARAAIEAAASASTDWATTPGPERGRILRGAAAALAARKDELAATLTEEEGKTIAEATGEVQRSIDIFYYYAEKAREYGGSLTAASSPGTVLYSVRQPIGVASLITPWNYPIAIPAWKIAPALATGTTVVIKPARLAPAPAIGLIEALEEAGLPSGVANLVTGSGRRVGGELVANDHVDAVSFTGSTSVGQMIYADAASRGKRVQTEMGGKNPTIVSDSADVREAASIVAAGAFGVTGQACTACSRAIVHEAILDEFLDALVDEAAAIQVGPGTTADMGPQASEDELSGTLDYIEQATSEGADIEFGGERLTGDEFDDGFYISPTVLSGVETGDTIACEEVFGPVVAVISVPDFDEAMAVANDVEFGLSASIVTNDHREAQVFLSEIQSGVAKVNDKTTGLELHVPFGGFKESSSETWREQGEAGMEFYSIEKTIYNNF